MLPPPSHPQNSRQKKLNKHKNKTKANKVPKTNKQRNKKKTKKKQQISKQTNKNNPSTVMPELVTLDCSLTHVLQVPNTQPYHS